MCVCWVRRHVAYRQIFPPNFPPLPTFRFKFIRVGTPNILSAMHNMHTKVARRALRDEDGRISIFTSAAGERSVFIGVAGV
jgi:hypothetical protein